MEDVFRQTIQEQRALADQRQTQSDCVAGAQSNAQLEDGCTGSDPLNFNVNIASPQPQLGGDDEPDFGPSPDEADLPPRSARDLKKPELFDWKWASNFAKSPEDVERMTEVDHAALRLMSMPGLTRRLWDEGIQPLVSAVLAEVLGDIDEMISEDEIDAKNPIGSLRVMQRRLMEGSPGVAPRMVDACRNHCCVFNSERRLEDKCPHCKKDRLDVNDKPYVQTAIFPLKNMLRSIISHQDRAKLCVDYRESFDCDDTRNGVRKDFWHGDEARSMMKPGGLLQDPTALALTISGDAAEYSAKPKNSIMPYMALIQNLPPNLRYKQEVCLALHLGEAKDDSVWEAIFKDAGYEGGSSPAHPLGVFYGDFEFSFLFCLGTGDYPFAAETLGLVPQAGRCNCRICSVAGYLGERAYYLVDTAPHLNLPPERVDDGNHVPVRYGHDASQVRTYEHYQNAIDMKLAATTGTARAVIQLRTGVSAEGSAAELVRRLPDCVPFHRLIPIDPMHGIPLNVCRQMLRFVTNYQKKYQDFPFCMQPSVQQAFLTDLKACTKDIPEELMRRPTVDFTKCTVRAEHFLAFGRLAPILLKNRLPDKFVRTFVSLSTIMDALAELQSEDVDGLEAEIKNFQKSFYEDWYAGDYERISLCLVYFHAMGHIPDAIRAWGPPFVFAQWAMERFNGKAIVYARLNASTPIATTANKVTNEFRMNQLLRPAPAKRSAERLGTRKMLRKSSWAFAPGEPEALAAKFGGHPSY